MYPWWALSLCSGSNHYKAAVECHRQGPYSGAHLRHQLAAAGVGCKIPYSDVPVLVPADYLPLVGMQDHRVDGRPRLIFSLARWRPEVPYTNRPVLAAAEHPLGVLLEAHRGDIACMAIVAGHWLGIVGVDFIYTDVWIPRGCEQLLV
eukprot:scaffold81109_cov36-Prasinocladus_malaysianus.AAC.2